VIGNEQPVHWRLLTTHPIKNEEDALKCIHWYKQRWHIEQLFRTLKKQGIDLESSLLEEGSRLEKLAVFACSAAVRTMQMTLAREGKSDRPATDAFTVEEIKVLERIQAQKEGKTDKQKNPHPKHSLAWAAWIIARLGGWKGYASERKPGPITMLTGLRAFESIYYGYLIALAA